MGAKALVDTSAWIEFYHPKGSDQVKRALAEALETLESAVVASVVVELLSGAKAEQAYEILVKDLQVLTYLPLDWEGSTGAARLGWELARTGRRVSTIDLLIASAAKTHGYEVWHFGDGHFAALASFGGPPHRDLTAESPSALR